MRKPLIIGNWKMNGTIADSQELISGIRKRISGVRGVEIVVAPPFTTLSSVASSLTGSSIILCAQNMHAEERGAYTGEISASMLLDVGCDYVIIGHSERRHIFNETDDMINCKIRRAIIAGLIPILCVGETLPERDSGNMMSVIAEQLTNGLRDVIIHDPDNIVIAYEPVWAIGTGKNASPAQAQEVHSFIRDFLRKNSGEVSEGIRILYGGSVKPDNIDDIMMEPDIDGVLVGGASLNADSFAGIIRFRSPDLKKDEEHSL